MAPLFGLRWAVVLSVLSGFLMWLAFAPVAFGPCAVLSVTALTAAAWRAGLRRGLLVGLIAGLVFFLPLLSWMRVIGDDAWLALAIYCALWLAAVGGASSLVTRLPAAPVWVGSVWVLEEALRGRVPLGGFPWGDIAFSQPDTVLVKYSALGGSAFLSFVVALLGAALVLIVVRFREGRTRPAAVWAGITVAVVLLAFAIRVPTDGDDVGGPDSAVVAVVQGGTPQYGMGAMDVRRAVLNNHVAQTLDLAQAVAAGTVEQPDFVLWPENSSDIDPFVDSLAAEAISA
ncbi:MAG: apolipoprotein N-acyltransferase, partial [bacterium]|nr:apolipoprotein N-acyltransferase [bacterium]